MVDIFVHAAFAGFIVATPPGLTQLIAFERTLNRSSELRRHKCFGHLPYSDEYRGKLRAKSQLQRNSQSTNHLYG